MKPQHAAIKMVIIEYIQKHGYPPTVREIANMLAWSHSDLRERLKAYEDTGLTPEQVQELAERDTAKKPIIIGVNGAIGCRVGECPKCGGILRSYMRFCDECGQRLDWRE
nr:hypothetical protein [bacterium]